MGLGTECSSSLRAIEPGVKTPLDAARSARKNVDETRVRADAEAFKIEDVVLQATHLEALDPAPRLVTLLDAPIILLIGSTIPQSRLTLNATLTWYGTF